MDEKTLRGSKTSSDGMGPASGFGLRHRGESGALAQRFDGKSNEITAIRQLFDMRNVKRAIVSVDTMGTQKEIASRIVDKGADYLPISLKGNQTCLHEDAALFLADPACAPTCTRGRDRRGPWPD